MQAAKPNWRSNSKNKNRALEIAGRRENAARNHERWSDAKERRTIYRANAKERARQEMSIPPMVRLV